VSLVARVGLLLAEPPDPARIDFEGIDQRPRGQAVEAVDHAIGALDEVGREQRGDGGDGDGDGADVLRLPARGCRRACGLCHHHELERMARDHGERPSSSWADPYLCLQVLAEWKGVPFTPPPLPK
jgi:hypothetical protein